MRVETKKATEDRQKANGEYQVTVADQRATQKLLTDTVGLLEGFYKESSLLQTARIKNLEKEATSRACIGFPCTLPGDMIPAAPLVPRPKRHTPVEPGGACIGSPCTLPGYPQSAPARPDPDASEEEVLPREERPPRHRIGSPYDVGGGHRRRVQEDGPREGVAGPVRAFA